MPSGVPRVAAGGERRPGASGGAWPADASAAPRGRPSRGRRPAPAAFTLPSLLPALSCPGPRCFLGRSSSPGTLPASRIAATSALCPHGGARLSACAGPTSRDSTGPVGCSSGRDGTGACSVGRPPFHVLVLAPAPHPAWTQGPRPVSVDIAPQPQALAPLLLASFLFLLVLVTWGNSFLVSSTVR